MARTASKRARYAPPLEDAPRLVPHAGLPGVDGTSRFCYGFVATGAASPSLASAPHAPAALDPSTPVSGAPADVPAAAVGASTAPVAASTPLAPGWEASGGYTAPARARA